MLIELRIENLAVVERLVLPATAGLNVLSGETGTGKSLIVGALSLLLGERASTEAVRTGASRAVIEGVFDIGDDAVLNDLLHENGIDAEDGLVILRREIAAEGRSRAWVNGAASTASFVGEIGSSLVDLHGQHEHQSLLHTRQQRTMLDRFAGAAGIAADVAAAYTRMRDGEAQLAELDARNRDIEQRATLLRHQVDEIERAAPIEGEEAELEAEVARLEHVDEIARLAGALHDGLYAGEDGVASRLDEFRRVLAQLSRLDPRVEEWRKVLDESFFTVQELGRHMGEYGTRLDQDPSRLDAIRRRLDMLFRLRAKYGPTLVHVIENGRIARAELDRLVDASADRNALEKAIVAARRLHADRCAALSERRRAAATRLDEAVTHTLPELGMTGAVFRTRLAPLDAPGAGGAESVEFLISVNAGFEPAPLSRVASGGEISRVMLALKSALADADTVPTLVFDEIDAGIGGRAAHRVAERLRDVATRHQVFAVTHLAQIAAYADHHLLVEKQNHHGVAAAAVIELSGDPRVDEVARLLGGDPESETSRAHARELLAVGSAVR